MSIADFSPLTLRFDGVHSRGRAMAVVVEDWAWAVKCWSGVIPAGFKTDLESVPKFAQWILPRAGRALRPALIHDWLISTWGYAREHDDVFMAALDLEGLRDLRVHPIRWALRWNTHRRLHAAAKADLGLNPQA